MRKNEIKNIMIIYSDNDFISVWDWIGKVALATIPTQNICACDILEDSEDIEKFILSLLPTAIEFLQYREDKYAEFVRYRDIECADIIDLAENLKFVKFVYNFDKLTNDDYKYGGSETLIIDFENNKSYIN